MLDPFDPDLHRSLLAGLDPPVEQVGTMPLFILYIFCRSFAAALEPFSSSNIACLQH